MSDPNDVTPLRRGTFNVTFDSVVLTGTMALRSVQDIDRLIKVLNAQKAALEAMQDDEAVIEEISAVMVKDQR